MLKWFKRKVVGGVDDAQVDGWMRRGFLHHQQGELALAEDWYRRILEVRPRYADALYLMGKIAAFQGRYDEAVSWIDKAIDVNPAVAAFHFDMGYSLEKMNRVAPAVVSYRKAVSLDAQDVEAWNNLGGLLLQQDELDEAERCFKKAIGISSDFAPAHYNVGRVFHRRGQYAEAVKAYRRALSERPDYVEGQLSLANALWKMKFSADAMQICTEVLRLEPENVEAMMLQGSLLKEREQWDEAEAVYKVILFKRPDLSIAHHNLAALYDVRGNFDEARKEYRTAISANAGQIESYLGLGKVLMQLGLVDEADSVYQEALLVNPKCLDALFNLGDIQARKGDPYGAITKYQQVLAVDSGRADACHGIGLALYQLGRYVESETYYKRAIENDREFTVAYYNFGNLLVDLGRMAEAKGVYSQAIYCQPSFAEAYNNLGYVFKEMDRMDAAVENFKRAIEIKPGFADAYNNMCNVLLERCCFDEVEAVHRKILESHNVTPEGYSNFLFLQNYHPSKHMDEIFSEYRHWYAVMAQHHECPKNFNNVTDPKRRLRVGYVSADFKYHSARFFIWPLLSNHDKSIFEIFCYSGVRQDDDVTRHYQKVVDHWRNVVRMDDDALAELIQKDGIDILVDLSGHTAGNRLLVFARTPAPIQATWLGYGYTTGMDTMDYFLADANFVPPDAERWFSEEVWRLPRPMFCYSPEGNMPLVKPLPAFRNGYVTFGCFSRTVRYNDKVVATWSKLLHAVPNSRLILNAKTFLDDETHQLFLQRFAANGIAEDRLSLVFTSPQLKTWETYNDIDIALDPFPHNAGTTTFEALWMGVPVISKLDRPSLGRFGAAILQPLGLDDWLAESEVQYVEIGRRWANDPDGLAKLRQELRERMRNSPFMDEVGFARAVEDAYQGMWRKWCAEQGKG